jgi:hypothetical protein
MSEAVMKEAAHPPRTIRSVGAVLTDIIVGVLLTIITDVMLHAIGVYPPSAQPMVNAIVAACNRLSRCLRCVRGYITARLAPDRPMRHALAGGVVGFVVCTGGAVVTWNRRPAFGPHWYPLAVVATAVPCASLGGQLRNAILGNQMDACNRGKIRAMALRKLAVACA